MRIVDLLDTQRVVLNAQAKDKSAVIDLLVNLQEKSGVLTDVSQYKEAVWERERQSSTGIEAGVAVPHAKSSAVKMCIRDRVETGRVLTAVSSAMLETTSQAVVSSTKPLSEGASVRVVES